MHYDHIMEIVQYSQSDALHPGYKMLAEDPVFVDMLTKQKITWVGPPSDVIRQLKDRGNTKLKMAKEGLPILPGYRGDN